MGTTSHGRLLDGARIPLEGRDYRFFDHIAERGTNFGTDEMKALLPRLGAAVRARVPGTPRLAVGNVSLRGGGRSPWHASHRAGRDVDLAFYVRDRRTGETAELENFARMGWRGISRDGRYVFDTRRNMELVRALLTDARVTPQWIFVARWLKRRILAKAQRSGLPEEVRRRMAEVLRQPSDSAPHDDHFHVRIYCSLQDRKYGCTMREPFREWADPGDEAFAAHVDELGRILELPRPGLRLAAVHLLERIDAVRATGALAERLRDDDRHVRRAALAALLHIAAPESGAPILAQLGRVRDPGWAEAIFGVYRRIAPPDLLRIAHILVRSPATLLHPDVRRTALPYFRVQAAEILAEIDRGPSVPLLLKLLSSPHAAVRAAAHRALLYVTNQRIGARGARARWSRFWARNRSRGWLAWMRSGFRSWGLHVSPGRLGAADVPRLIRALRHRSRVVRRNAERVLTALTGHEISEGYRRKLRGPRLVARHWRFWWRRHRRRLRSRIGTG